MAGVSKPHKLQFDGRSRNGESRETPLGIGGILAAWTKKNTCTPESGRTINCQTTEPALLTPFCLVSFHPKRAQSDFGACLSKQLTDYRCAFGRSLALITIPSNHKLEESPRQTSAVVAHLFIPPVRSAECHHAWQIHRDPRLRSLPVNLSARRCAARRHPRSRHDFSRTIISRDEFKECQFQLQLEFQLEFIKRRKDAGEEQEATFPLIDWQEMMTVGCAFYGDTTRKHT